jgi:gamma-glutamyltranspeptidase
MQPPPRHNRKPEKYIHETLVFSTGLHEEVVDILNKLPKGTAIVFDDLELEKLQKLGHKTVELDHFYGNMQVIVIDKKSGEIEAETDGRRAGSAEVLH